MIQIEIINKQVKYVRGYPPGIWVATQATGGMEYALNLKASEWDQVLACFEIKEHSTTHTFPNMVKRTERTCTLIDKDNLELVLSLILVNNGLL